MTPLDPVRRCGAATARGWRSLKGYRTYAVFVPALLLAVLDALHAIDFRQALIDIGLPENSAKAVVAGCFLAGIVLRTVTSTPPGRRDG